MPGAYPWLADEHASRMADTLLIDCAVHGMPNDDPERDWTALLEAQTFACDGIKSLLARNHYTRQRFFEIYHQPNYTAAKQHLDPPRPVLPRRVREAPPRRVTPRWLPTGAEPRAHEPPRAAPPRSG
jgi:hypothetical protein